MCLLQAGRSPVEQCLRTQISAYFESEQEFELAGKANMTYISATICICPCFSTVMQCPVCEAELELKELSQGCAWLANASRTSRMHNSLSA